MQLPKHETGIEYDKEVMRAFFESRETHTRLLSASDITKEEITAINTILRQGVNELSA